MRNFNHLYYFYIVAKLKSVTAAAVFLKTSQPSLTTQIKTLEMSIGKILYKKKGRMLELTPEGLKLFEICSKMFEVNEELEDFVQDVDSNAVKINIGVCNEIPREFITAIIGQVLNKYKISNRPNIKITSGTHGYLVEQLKLAKINFILTNNSENDLSLKILKEYTLPVIVAGSPGFIKKIKLKSLKNTEEILTTVSSFFAIPSEHLKLREETNLYFLHRKLKYKTIFESDIIASIIRSTMDGMTFCLLPQAYIQKELDMKLLRPLTAKNELWDHRIYIISRNNIDKFNFIKNLVVELDHLA